MVGQHREVQLLGGEKETGRAIDVPVRVFIQPKTKAPRAKRLRARAER
jgi:hypothetical protein